LILFLNIYLNETGILIQVGAPMGTFMDMVKMGANVASNSLLPGFLGGVRRKYHFSFSFFAFYSSPHTPPSPPLSLSLSLSLSPFLFLVLSHLLAWEMWLQMNDIEKNKRFFTIFVIPVISLYVSHVSYCPHKFLRHNKED
jgi:hypothetical protein